MKKIWNVAEKILTALAAVTCVVYWIVNIYIDWRESKKRVDAVIAVQSELARQKGYDEGWNAASNLYDNDVL